MKFVNLEGALSREQAMQMLEDSDYVNDKVLFDEKRGKPRILVKRRRADAITVRCKMIGGASVDNGFLEGTYFRGTLRERDGKVRLKGVIITAPIYHTILFGLLLFFIVWCVLKGSFNPVPLIYFIFSFIMFRTEFMKQGIIYRYFLRAFRKAEEKSEKK